MSLSVTVLLPVHKNTKNFFTTLRACLNQNYENFIIYILIDQYNDFLFSELKKKYRNEIDHQQKIKIYYPKKKLGLTKILNKGLLLSESDLIMRNDHDDIPVYDKIRLQVEKFKSNKKLKMVYTYFSIIDEVGKELKLKCPKYSGIDLKKKLTYKNPIAHSSVMFERKFILKLGGYNNNYLVSQDFELWGRIINNDLNNIDFINKKLVKIRYSKNTISYIKSIDQRANSIIICMNNKFFPKRFENINISNLNFNEKIYFYALNSAYLFEKKIYVLFSIKYFIFLVKIYINHPSLLYKRFIFYINKNE